MTRTVHFNLLLLGGQRLPGNERPSLSCLWGRFSRYTEQHLRLRLEKGIKSWYKGSLWGDLIGWLEEIHTLPSGQLRALTKVPQAVPKVFPTPQWRVQDLRDITVDAGKQQRWRVSVTTWATKLANVITSVDGNAFLHIYHFLLL